MAQKAQSWQLVPLERVWDDRYLIDRGKERGGVKEQLLRNEKKGKLLVIDSLS